MQNENVDSKVYEEIKEKIVIEKLCDVKMKKIDWLWENIIAYGKITLFAGEPGMGKSQILLYIASIISNGEIFHLEKTKCERGKVLLITNEDNVEDTIKPRLSVLKANMNNIHSLKGIRKTDKKGNEYYDVISLVEHLYLLEDQIIEEKYKLIVVDPITMYLGSTDQNQNKEIRTALGMLQAVAERHKTAMLINSHFTKQGNVKKAAIERIMGSVGFAGAARIIFGMIRDPEDENKRLFMPIKNNLGPDDFGYQYVLSPQVLINGIGEIKTCKIDWLEGKVDKKIDDIINTVKVEKDSPRLAETIDFLLEELKYEGQFLTDLRKKAEAKGIGMNRLYEAKKLLNLYEDDHSRRKRWYISPSTPEK